MSKASERCLVAPLIDIYRFERPTFLCLLVRVGRNCGVKVTTLSLFYAWISRKPTIYADVQRIFSPLLPSKQGWGGWRGFFLLHIKPITKQKIFNFSGRGIDSVDVADMVISGGLISSQNQEGFSELSPYLVSCIEHPA